MLLIPLELHDFDLILGMDWLGLYWAQMDCLVKTLTLYGTKGDYVMFRGEKSYS